MAILAGLMATTAQPPFPGTGVLMIVALALLFGLLVPSPSPARTGWWFGLGHQFSLLHWLFLLGPDASISFRWLIPLAAVLAILYASAFYALLGWAIGRARRWQGEVAALGLAPVLWVGMEVLRGAGELGFPWCLSGMAWVGTPVRSLAATSGEIGLAAATAFAGAAVVAALNRGRGSGAGRTRSDLSLRAALPAVAALLWLLLAAGALWPASRPAGDGRPVRLAAIQANVALRDKWQESRLDSTVGPHTRLTSQAAAEGAILAVWAETAVPAYLLHEPALLDWVRGQARENGFWLYAGFPHYTLGPRGAPRRTNSSGLFDPSGELKDRYDKHHLLPFGERMPFQKVLPWLGQVDFGQAEWSPGARPAPMQVSYPGGAFRFSGLICFEAIFSGLAREATRAGSDLLVNITNDGWFGWTAGPRQHAEMARMRAAECGVPLLRCANNGISFITDARGGILAGAGLNERAAVIADVTPSAGRTLFVRWGSWPLAGLLLVWSFVACALARRPAAAGAGSGLAETQKHDESPGEKR